MSEQEMMLQRLDKAEDAIETLMVKVNKAALDQVRVSERLDSLLVTLGEVKQGLSALQQKPAQRWDTIITQCLSVLAAALIGLLLGS